MKRTPSLAGSAVFGVEITTLGRREGRPVPTIVTACLREVERRGKKSFTCKREKRTSLE